MEDTKLTDLLGHEDIDSKECKDGRSRTWMLLLYEDDPTHKSVLDERLPELDWNYAGRIHDKDDGVKPHHHVVVLFKDGRKNTDVASDLGLDKRWLRAWDRQKKALRYLCHRDNLERFQYSTDGIYGTIAEKAVAACSKGNELSEQQSVKDIVALLDSIEGYVSYKYFLSLLSNNGCYPVFRRMGIIGTRLLDEHNREYQKKFEREFMTEKGRVVDVESFERFVKWEAAHPDDIPFDKRVDVLERQGFFRSPPPL